MNISTMLSETTPLGLNIDWWTALAVISALAIAHGGAFLPKISKFASRPKLRIAYSRIAEFSSEVNGAYWLRVPIYNEGSSAAKNVEAFLELFAKLSAEGEKSICGMVPMRLKWCHIEQPTYPAIPAQCYRLLHLGYVELQARTFLQDGTLSISFPSLTLGGEVGTVAHAPLALGAFQLVITISADGIKPETHTLRVIVRRFGEHEGYPAKVEKV